VCLAYKRLTYLIIMLTTFCLSLAYYVLYLCFVQFFGFFVIVQICLQINWYLILDLNELLLNNKD